MKKIILSILFVYSIYSAELYKEIKINYSDLNNINVLSELGLDVDHSYKTDTFIQFAINEYDLAKIINNNIPYIIIHEDLESFYANRLDQDYFERDFELGSMGGYYTFEEIEENLDELSKLITRFKDNNTSCIDSLSSLESLSEIGANLDSLLLLNFRSRFRIFS